MKDYGKILVGYTNYHGYTSLSVLASMWYLRKTDKTYFGAIGRLLCPEARNLLLREARDKDYEYLFFIDDDNELHKDSLMHLLNLDKDIAGCAYIKRQDEKVLVPMRKHGDTYVPYKTDELGKLQKVEIVGMGCTLIKRKVITAMLDNYPHPYQYLTGSRVLGEDVTFCERAKMLGFEVWCSTELKQGHVGDPQVYYFGGGGDN